VENDLSLSDRIVVITGAGRPNGIGAGIARCFAEAGAKVVVTDLEGAPLDETAAAISADVSGMVADAADQKSMSRLAEQVLALHGRIDVLVNNAGIGGPVLEFEEAAAAEAVLAMSDAAWDTQLAANLRTTFSSAAALAPHIARGGSIVNIASIAALGPTPQLPAYGAAKAGVVHLTRTLAMELAPRRIRVNCICPGLLWTRAWEMLAGRMKVRNPEFANMTERQIFETLVAAQTPLGGEQTPQDIGHLAVFYASDRARMITGQIVAVDGGISVA
jgi:NAD(P)-dependent dehydrogenase (short-subunit alcohol dehydrogenase family)